MGKLSLNLYKYTLKENQVIKYGPILCGILHEDGKKIASDSNIMCIIPSRYSADKESKIIDRKRKVIEGKYPDWQRATPPSDFNNLIELDLNKLRVCHAALSEFDVKEKYIRIVGTSPEDTYFDARHFSLFIDFLSHYPDCKFYFTDHTRALKAEDEFGRICLLMPYCGKFISKEDSIIVDYVYKDKPVVKVQEIEVNNGVPETAQHFAEYDYSMKREHFEPGTHVEISAGDPKFPYCGVVQRCYEFGPDAQDEYAVIVKLDDEIISYEAVKNIYPRGLMLCKNSEIRVVENQSLEIINNDDIMHCTERYLRDGCTLTEILSCRTGQFIYALRPRNGQEELSSAVLENGSCYSLYNIRGTDINLMVTKFLINGYDNSK